MSAQSLSPENEAWRYEATFSVRGTKVRLTRNTPGVFEKKEWCNDLESIGQGGFGNVFLQRHRDSTTGEEQIRATKRVNLSQTTGLTKYINRELKALIIARDYPEMFVMFHGWYQDNYKNMFIVMDYVPGGDLERFMEENRESAKAKCQETTKQLLVGIDVLHQHKICHRDLKPANILVASMNPFCVKICDFGIAKGMDASGMVTRIGTQRYMAPEIQRQHLSQEQANRETEYSNAVDIWAIGIICHELYTGYIPFWYPVSPEASASWSTLPSGFDSGLAPAPAQAALRLDELRSYCLRSIPFPEGHLETNTAPDQLKDFIKLLLKPEPNDRPKAGLALKHPWIASSPNQTTTPPPDPVAVTVQDSGESDNEDGAPRIICPYCDRHVDSLRILRDHILRIHVQPLQCSCGKRFGVQHELDDHRNSERHTSSMAGEKINAVPHYVLDFSRQIEKCKTVEELRSVMFDGDIKAYDLADDSDSLYWVIDEDIFEEDS